MLTGIATYQCPFILGTYLAGQKVTECRPSAPGGPGPELHIHAFSTSSTVPFLTQRTNVHPVELSIAIVSYWSRHCIGLTAHLQISSANSIILIVLNYFAKDLK